MRLPDEILINNKIKAYRLIDQFYLTRCGSAYKLNKTGGYRKKKLNWNQTQYRINIRQKICSFAKQMLKVFKPKDYETYMKGKYNIVYLDGNRKNLHIDNLGIMLKQKYKYNEKVVYIEKPPRNIIFDQQFPDITELEIMLEAKEHEIQVSKYQRELQAKKTRKRQEELDARNKAKMAAKKAEEDSKYSFHIWMHPEGYFCIKVLINNELVKVAKHHSHERLHNYGLWCEGTDNEQDIKTEGLRISNELQREMPQILDSGEAWTANNENRRYCS